MSFIIYTLYAYYKTLIVINYTTIVRGFDFSDIQIYDALKSLGQRFQTARNPSLRIRYGIYWQDKYRCSGCQMSVFESSPDDDE